MLGADLLLADVAQPLGHNPRDLDSFDTEDSVPASVGRKERAHDPDHRRPQAQPKGTEPIVPIGFQIPHTQDDLNQLPLGQWDLHTPESWAMAVLQEAMDVASRPPQSAPGQPQPPPTLPFGNAEMDVQFSVLDLGDGSIGVAATFLRAAPGGKEFFNHHLVRLHVRPSQPRGSQQPVTDQT
jgi:hypothetical protein